MCVYIYIYKDNFVDMQIEMIQNAGVHTRMLDTIGSVWLARVAAFIKLI